MLKFDLIAPIISITLFSLLGHFGMLRMYHLNDYELKEVATELLMPKSTLKQIREGNLTFKDFNLSYTEFNTAVRKVRANESK